MPDISVIVPVYKVEAYLRQCVDSILAQTYANFKLVLVDDGSPDNCGRICDEYESADSRVQVIHRANGGLSAARNSGLDWTVENLDVKWVLFVDGDDALAPNAIEKLYIAATSYQVEIAVMSFCPVKSLDDLAPINDAEFEVISPHDFWLRGQTKRVVAWGKLFRIDLFKGIRFPEGKICEDEFTTPFVLFKTNKVVVTSSPFYRYLQRDDSIMGRKWTVARLDGIEAKARQEKYFRMLGMDDLAIDAVERCLNYMGACLSGMRTMESRGELEDQYRRLHDDLHTALKCHKSSQSFPIGANYQCYHGLHPFIVNRFTWLIFRSLYYMERGAFLTMLKSVLERMIQNVGCEGKSKFRFGIV